MRIPLDVPPTLFAHADEVIELADMDAARSGPHGMQTKVHFAFRIDIWDYVGGHIAGATLRSSD